MQFLRVWALEIKLTTKQQEHQLKCGLGHQTGQGRYCIYEGYLFNLGLLFMTC